MSKIISFRISEDNPREKIALEILRERAVQGYSIRQTIVDSLLCLRENSISCEGGSNYSSVIKSIESLSTLFHNYFTDKPIIERNDMGSQQIDLSPSFLTSIKTVLKPGLKS